MFSSRKLERYSWVPLTLLVSVFVLAGCSAESYEGGSTELEATPIATIPDRPSVSTIRPTELPSPIKAGKALESLSPADRVSPTQLNYQRSAFGSGWRDPDGNGCNQRDDVLLRDGVPHTVRVVRQGACDHDVIAGRWIDPYTGRQVELDDLKDHRQAQAIQIDHIVPLAEAWVSGAAEWSEEKRRAFANDLDELLAADGPTNASKSDGDPAAWRPKKRFQCDYARRWIGVKAKWDLAVDASERRALTEMLTLCPT